MTLSGNQDDEDKLNHESDASSIHALQATIEQKSKQPERKLTVQTQNMEKDARSLNHESNVSSIHVAPDHASDKKSSVVQASFAVPPTEFVNNNTSTLLKKHVTVIEDGEKLRVDQGVNQPFAPISQTGDS